MATTHVLSALRNDLYKDLMLTYSNKICRLISKKLDADEHIKSNFLRGSRIDRHSQRNQFFFNVAQNIPFGKLHRGKIVLVSSNLFFGRNFEKFEKCTSGVVSTLQNNGITW